jgi:hypothetical protein
MLLAQVPDPIGMVPIAEHHSQLAHSTDSTVTD